MSTLPYQDLVEEAAIGIFVARPNEGFVMVNERACAMTGYEEEELLGTSPDALLPPGQQSADQTFAKLKQAGAVNQEVTIVRKDGTEFLADIRISEGPIGHAIGFMRDVTAKRQAQEQISEQLAALESAPVGIAILNEEARYVYVNPAHAEIYGFADSEAMVGKSWRCLYNPSEVRFFEQEVLPQLEAGQGWQGEVPALRTDDTSIETDVSLTPLDTGGLVCICRDVSQRNRRERQMELLNRMLRHDIGNAAGKVIGFADLLDGTEDPDKRASYEWRILQAGSKITQLTKTARVLMRSIREDELETEPMNLTPVVAKEIQSVRNLYERARISGPDRREEPCYVNGSQMLSTVIANLLQNAIEHNESDPVEIEVSLQRHASDQVHLRVADNGSGVPQVQKEAIFGRGKKGVESTGTGIGLYLASEVTRMCGGTIWVEDNDPSGAVFITELPAASSPESG